MEKSKLGISIGVLSALCYFIALGSFTGFIVLFGYIFLQEQSNILKRHAFKAMMLSIAFMVAGQIIGAVSSLDSILSSLIRIHFIPFTLDSVLLRAIDIFKIYIFLTSALAAFQAKTVTVPFVEKYMSQFESQEEFKEQ